MDGENDNESKLKATLNDVGRLSIFPWAATIALTVIWSMVGKKGFQDAFVTASLFAAVVVVGQGVFGLGGGQISWTDPISRGARRRNRKRESLRGALTPFGVSLVVAPQLLLVAFLVSNSSRR